jgi:membrane-associated phospholipid phosphatase
METYFKNAFFLLIISLFCQSEIQAQSESPYRISWKYDAPILGGAFLTNYASKFKRDNTPTLTQEYLDQLNKNDIWAFERGVVDFRSDQADDWSDVTLVSSYLSTIGLFAFSDKFNKKFLPPLVIALEAYYLNRATTGWFKASFLRTRPFAYNPDADLDIKKRLTARLSFFSGHTSISSTLYFTTAKMFSDYYPNAKAKPFVWAAAISIPAVTGYLRVRAGKHFYTDVIAGYASGALFGILVPHFHKKRNTEKATSLRVMPSSEGVYLGLNF